MKKKLVSMLALSMCFCVGVSSFAGCKDGDDSSTGGGGGGNTPLTQDQIYDKIVEAAEATMAYTGGYTSTIVDKENESGKTTTAGVTVQETYLSQETTVSSVDTANKKLYMNSVETETTTDEEGVSVTETEEMTGKLFKEGDKYYTYMKQKATSTEEGAETEEGEMYAEMSEFSVMLNLRQYSLAENSSEYFSQVNLGDMTIDAYNAAWATVFTDSKAAVAAGTNDEESDWYQCTADGSNVISCSEVDGAYVLSVKMNISVTMGENSMGGTEEMTVTAKDGKIVSVVTKETYTETYKEGDVTETEVELYESTINLSYAFAENDYNAVTTTLPTDPAQIMKQPDYFYGEVDVVINGISNSIYTSGAAVEGILGNIASYGMEVVWYTDAACTQALDATTMTLAQFVELDAVYGTATAQEGYVLYTNENVTAFAADVTDAYKVVFSSMVETEKHLNTAYIDSGIDLSKYRDNVTITVNGTEVTFEEGETWKQYSVEAGQTYAVKKVTTYAKADLNIFSMYM